MDHRMSWSIRWDFLLLFLSLFCIIDFSVKIYFGLKNNKLSTNTYDNFMWHNAMLVANILVAAVSIYYIACKA